jgi:hypothetical protein
MGLDRSRFSIASVIKIILIVAVILFTGTCIFMLAKIRMDADSALRNAKNVRMSLRSADVEMYAQGKTIYNPSKKNGLEDGVKAKVDLLADAKGTYSITRYDSKTHELTGMTYRQGNYIVYFSKEGDDITWDVDLLMNIYHFDESDVITE